MFGELNRDPAFPIGKGKSHVKASLVGTDRRSRSRVRVWIVGSASLAWVQVLEEWGAYVEAVVEDIPQSPKNFRRLVTSTAPPITTSQALVLEP